METDVKETVQRKVGPLPVWGWVVAIGGAVFVLRKLRGGSSAPVQYVGTPSVVGSGGGGGVTGGTGTDNTGETTLLQSQLDTLSQRVDSLGSIGDAITGLDTQIAGLATTVSNETSFNQFQTKLIDLIAQRDNALAIKQKAELDLARDRARYADKIINLNTYNADVAKYQPIIDAQTKNIASIDSQIATIKSDMTKVGA